MVANIVALVMLVVVIAIAFWVARRSPKAPRWKYWAIALSGVAVFSLLQFKSAVGQLGFPSNVLLSGFTGFVVAWVVGTLLGVRLAWWQWK